MRRWWPHGRALLIALHLLAVFLLALPASNRLSDQRYWHEPAQQAGLRSWAGRLGMPKEELQTFLWDLSQSYVKTRRRLVWPFLIYADYSGARQGWTMFANPRRTTGRFDIEIETEGQWHAVYNRRSDALDWKQWQFEHNRVRKLIGRLINRPHQPAYNEFSRWIARSLAAEFPRATRARIRLITWKTLGPAERRAGEAVKESLIRDQEYSLGELR